MNYHHYPTSYWYKKHQRARRIQLLKSLAFLTGLIFLAIVASNLLWKVATYDYCPTYNHLGFNMPEKCLYP